MTVKQIEITNFKRENEDGMYIDYIEGCFQERKEYSFLVLLYPTPSEYSTLKETRISEIYLQDFSKHGYGKVWHTSFGTSNIKNEPEDSLLKDLYQSLLANIEVEIDLIEEQYPPQQPFLPSRALKAYKELKELGVSVSHDLGYGNHTAFIIRWRNEDSYPYRVHAKHRGRVLEEDGTLEGKKINHLGLRNDVAEILDKYELYWEWHDIPIISVYKNYWQQGGFEKMRGSLRDS
ncbi:MAG: hypothetical protein JJ909_02985 [Roseivirga sp.]|nr:hypothetical protein [Roseivirga sp.]